MKILITNDDGYRAPGILALRDVLRSLPGVQTEVVAPEQNNSAKSNALSLHTPLYIHEAGDGVRFVNGTPADCVHVALTGLLGYRPDLVVSGINNGANMGDDTIYSGTVAAAMEAYLFGVPAIAFSQTTKGWDHLDAAAAKARELVEHVISQQLIGPEPWLLNVNIPPLPLAQLKGFKVCHLGRRHAAEPVTRQVNPHGQTMYWIGAAGPAKDEGEGTDFHATALGHMSVTPLQVDLTDHARLGFWRQVVPSAGPASE